MYKSKYLTLSALQQQIESTYREWRAFSREEIKVSIVRHIVRVINRLSPKSHIDRIIKGRSELGYSTAMNLIAYADSDALCKTSPQDLSRRQSVLMQSVSATSVGSIGNTPIVLFPTCYYRSVTHCVH
jgi:hypothetical protein